MQIMSTQNHNPLVPWKQLHLTITKMEFERTVHVFCTFFSLSASLHSVYASIWRHGNRKSLIFFPHFFICCWLWLRVQSFLPIFPEVVDTVVTYLLIGSECALNFSVIVQPILFREPFKRLYRKYVALQKYIAFWMERICIR